MTYQSVQTYTKRSNSIKTTSTKLAGKRDSSLKMHVFLCSQVHQATRTTSESKAFHFLFLICFLACSHQFTTSVSWNRCLRGLNQTSLLTTQRTSKCSIVSSSWEQRAHTAHGLANRGAPGRSHSDQARRARKTFCSCWAPAFSRVVLRSPTPTDQQKESGTLMPVTP
jgi:hypothetical protein